MIHIEALPVRREGRKDFREFDMAQYVQSRCLECLMEKNSR